MNFEKLRCHCLIPALMVTALFPWHDGQSETVELRPVADTTLIETAPDSNLGGHTFFNAGTSGIGTKNRGLVRFDLASAIPQDAVIEAAFLRLTVVFIPVSQFEFSLFGIHRVLVPWGEGDKVPDNPFSPGLGAPATGHEATWNNRFHDTREGWSIPGGQAGVDFVANASSGEFLETEGTYLFDITPRLINDVQGWVANPQSNYGWILATFSEEVEHTARRFGSREDPDNAPVLTVTYQVVPEPGTLSLLGLGMASLWFIRRISNRRDRG